MDVGQVRLRIDGRERFTTVVFGEPGRGALLGATGLELFNLGVDPVGQRLTPVRGLLMQTTSQLREAAPSRTYDPFAPASHRQQFRLPKRVPQAALPTEALNR